MFKPNLAAMKARAEREKAAAAAAGKKEEQKPVAHTDFAPVVKPAPGTQAPAPAAAEVARVRPADLFSKLEAIIHTHDSEVQSGAIGGGGGAAERSPDAVDDERDDEHKISLVAGFFDNPDFDDPREPFDYDAVAARNMLDQYTDAAEDRWIEEEIERIARKRARPVMSTMFVPFGEQDDDEEAVKRYKAGLAQQAKSEQRRESVDSDPHRAGFWKHSNAAAGGGQQQHPGWQQRRPSQHSEDGAGTGTGFPETAGLGFSGSMMGSPGLGFASSGMSPRLGFLDNYPPPAPPVPVQHPVSALAPAIHPERAALHIHPDRLAQQSNANSLAHVHPDRAHVAHAIHPGRAHQVPQVASSPPQQESRRVVVLENLATATELNDELEQDIRGECESFGWIADFVIFLLPSSVSGAAPSVRVFVRYVAPRSAAECVHKMHGRFFDGREVKARLYDDAAFSRHEYHHNR